MRANLQKDLLIIAAITALLSIVIVAVPSSPVRVVFGLPFLLFFPGYTLIAALFPRKTDLDGIERVALSFGLSIAVVPLVGLVLNYAWEIRLYPILISLAVFIVVTSGIAWYRRRQFTPGERFTVSFDFRLPSWTWGNGVDKALKIALAISIVGAIGTLAYVIAVPKEGEKFTEFYILGLDGKAEWYPTEFQLEEGQVVLVGYVKQEYVELKEEAYGRLTLGIVNHEHREATYAVEVVMADQRVRVWEAGEEVDSIGPVVLEDEDKWEQPVGFAPTEAGGYATLAAPVVKGEKRLSVTSTAGFEAGDHVKIGAKGEGDHAEFAEIDYLNDSECTVTLKEELEYDHYEGDVIAEQQTVRFVLYMDGEPYFEDDEALHLWVQVRESR